MNLILGLFTIVVKWYIGISMVTMFLMKTVMVLYEIFMKNGDFNRHGIDEDKQNKTINSLYKTFGGIKIIRAAIQWPIVLVSLVEGFIVGINEAINEITFRHK